MNLIKFQDVKNSNLIIDCIYEGGTSSDSSSESLYKLIPNCPIMGGFRNITRKDNSGKNAFLVLFTTKKEPDWPNELCLETGVYRYYGDNKEKEKIYDTKGNRILKEIFENLNSNNGKIKDIPPIFIFERSGKRGSKFLGLAAPGNPGISPNNELNIVYLDNDKKIPNYEAYFTILDTGLKSIKREWLNCLIYDNENNLKYAPVAWKDFIERGRKGIRALNSTRRGINYWAISTEEKTSLWSLFYENNLMSIGWDYTGDLNDYNENDIDILTQIIVDKKKLERKNRTSSKALLKFAKDVKQGDYVFAKKGFDKVLGLGLVTSKKYYYDESRKDEYKHCWNVKWLKKLDIKIENLFNRQFTFDMLTEEQLNKILNKCNLEDDHMMNKFLPKNKIYYGAPGTGKSHKLNEDKELLMVDNDGEYERVTFHPDYSYANFVGTYKPLPEKDENDEKTGEITYGFVPGPFLRILVKAFKHPKNNYLVIIEEINRANTAAVFGDVFQLLDRKREENDGNELEKGCSEYPIETSEEMKDYLIEKLDAYDTKLKIYDYKKIWIPENMFIYATMNSADQGVYPMDTAFKRRWDFEYLNINNKSSELSEIEYQLGNTNQKSTWNNLRTEINKKLLKINVNEDKLLGPHFIPDDLDEEEFNSIFKNKVLMYLFEDIPKSKNELFKNYEDEPLTLSDVLKNYDDYGVEVFCEEISNEFIREYEEENE